MKKLDPLRSFRSGSQIAFACALSCAAFAAPQSMVTRISELADGVPANGPSSDGGPGSSGLREAVSADGRHVAFTSSASDFVAGDTNLRVDVFVCDRRLQLIRRVSLASTGAQLDRDSHTPSLSADGRFVTFLTLANNVVPGDTNSKTDVFLRDLVTGTTTRQSLAWNGADPIGSISIAMMSADASTVAFVTNASNIVPNDTNQRADVFVRDVASGVVSRVSVDSFGLQGNGESNYPELSADGRFVAFLSWASNLHPSDVNFNDDLFVHDRATGLTERITKELWPPQEFDSFAAGTISADGRYLAFRSELSSLVVGDTNGQADIFFHDRLTGVTTLISQEGGLLANGSCGAPVISGDGNFVVFSSAANNLAPNDNNGESDLFVWRRSNSGITRVSVAPDGSDADGWSGPGGISADGKTVVFHSRAQNLTNGIPSTGFQVYAYDAAPLAALTYCTAGATAQGCSAVLESSGKPSVSQATPFTITARKVEGLRTGLYLYGVDNWGYEPLAWGTGSSFLCVKPPLQRTPTQNAGGTAGQCDGTFVLDWNAFHVAHPGALGAPFAPGQHVYAQAWYRDPAGAKTSSLSNALAFVMQP